MKSKRLAELSGSPDAKRGDKVFQAHTRNGDGFEGRLGVIVSGAHTHSIGARIRETVYDSQPETTDYTFTEQSRLSYYVHQAHVIARNILAVTMNVNERLEGVKPTREG